MAASSDDIDQLIITLLADGRDAVASEIQVLKAIYGDSLNLWHPENGPVPPPSDSHLLRLTVSVVLDQDPEVQVKVLVSLPSSYPTTTPPQLQLLDRYLGPFGIDSELFGTILRTYISTTHGVEWSPDSACIFDGITWVHDQCLSWYKHRLSQNADSIANRPSLSSQSPNPDQTSPGDGELSTHHTVLPTHIRIFEADPIVDRKSSFVGRACAISDPSEVSQVLSFLSADKRIARAAHPVINAWRCQIGGVLHQDNDDDGETAAGGRLAHLLQILGCNNVLVIVTRYFGGIHLGPDRFKHINQAARNALELGGFLDDLESAKKAPKGRTK